MEQSMTKVSVVVVYSVACGILLNDIVGVVGMRLVVQRVKSVSGLMIGRIFRGAGVTMLPISLQAKCLCINPSFSTRTVLFVILIIGICHGGWFCRIVYRPWSNVSSLFRTNFV